MLIGDFEKKCLGMWHQSHIVPFWLGLKLTELLHLFFSRSRIKSDIKCTSISHARKLGPLISTKATKSFQNLCWAYDVDETRGRRVLLGSAAAWGGPVEIHPNGAQDRPLQCAAERQVAQHLQSRVSRDVQEVWSGGIDRCSRKVNKGHVNSPAEFFLKRHVFCLFLFCF